MSRKNPDKQQKFKKINIQLLAASSYLFFFCILPIIFNKKNDFVIHHAKHGVALFSIEVATVLLSIMPFFGLFLSPFILSFCIFSSAWGILGVIKNQYSRMLVLSDIAQKIHI